FEWVRLNTPKDAVFALDPDYPNDANNDRQGFRAQAERSALPDRTKDGGVAALFPDIARSWRASTGLTDHLNSLKDNDAIRLQQAGVSWIVIRHASGVRPDCPYSNEIVSESRLHRASDFEAQ